jgi:deoxyadenosine/deoxycytidine kinase
MKMFWQDKYYDLKWGIWATYKYFRTVWKMRDYDYNNILVMMKFQLELLCDRIEFRGFEVEEDRMKKVKDMRRVIELLHNQIEDNFTERCGYDYNYKIDFVECEDKKGYYEAVDNKTKEQDENNDRALKEASKLEEDEWNELWDTIKNGKHAGYGMWGWWD